MLRCINHRGGIASFVTTNNQVTRRTGHGFGLKMAGLAAELSPGAELHANIGINRSQLRSFPLLNVEWLLKTKAHSDSVFFFEVEKMDPESMNQELVFWSGWVSDYSFFFFLFFSCDVRLQETQNEVRCIRW